MGKESCTSGLYNYHSKVLAADIINYAEFGYKVDLSYDGNTALLTGPGDSGVVCLSSPKNGIGAAWVFRFNE
jgi:hypothetical protein